MSKVLIISKTRKGQQGACVGGIIVPELKSVRLLNTDGTHHKVATTEFQIGQLWEMDLKPPAKFIPPHVENVLIQSKKLINKVDSFESVIDKQELAQIVWEGHPQSLFQGCLYWTGNRHGYIQKDIPEMSTGFWIPDKDLIFDGGKYYIYDDGREKWDSRFGFKYVGFEKPIDTIAAGTRVRVSLATWWHPDDIPDMPDRCYLQLSGWYNT